MLGVAVPGVVREADILALGRATALPGRRETSLDAEEKPNAW